MSDDIYEIDVIYVSITWLLAQVVVAARKTFYSAIPQNHEQRRNIPANCKTVPGALNSIRTAINIVVATWVLLAVAIVGLVVGGLVLDFAMQL